MAKKEDIIETIDEDGNTVKFELFDVIEYSEQDYALLLPVGEENVDEEPELVLMKLVDEGGEDYSLETIDDEDEFEEVAEYISNIEEEMEDEE